MTPAKFRALVWRFYKKEGRHDLPWRKTTDLYKILVSEVMLQQTQVDRVVPLYKNFIKKFPTEKKLAEASLSEVLKSWQGLGYNRRAKMLHDAAKVLSETSRSNLEVSELEKLPGVGPYTARAVAAFAYNKDVIVIETNIRTVIIHHFFPKKKKVGDAEIEKILAQVLPKGRAPLRQGYTGQAREWYSALMDYGAYLKRSGISHNARTTKHVVQKKFAGSLREVRGAILRELATNASRSNLEAQKGVPTPRFRTRLNLVSVIEKKLGKDRHEQILQALDDLCIEGLVQKKGRNYALAD